MKRSLLTALATGVFSLLAGLPASAETAYLVTIDTSSVNGTSGFLDLQFNPGNGTSQAATAQIIGFSSDGTLSGLPDIDGDVSGTLPAQLTLNNSTPLNDLFQPLTFGNTISFLLVLSGPALSSPNGTANAGTTFAVGLYDSSQQPILTNQGMLSGSAGEVDINLNGSTTATAFPTLTGPSVVKFTPTLSPTETMFFLWFFNESGGGSGPKS